MESWKEQKGEKGIKGKKATGMRNFLFVKFALRFLGIGSKTHSTARLSLLGAALGIGISIVPLVVTLVVTDGMVQGISNRTVELGTGQAQVVNVQPRSYSSDCKDEIAIKEMLRHDMQDSFLCDAWVQREGQGLLVGKKGRSGGVIRAIDGEFFTENKRAKGLMTIIAGEPTLKLKNSIVLGKKIAEKLSLGVGDVCRLITLRENHEGKKVPKVSVFNVEAIISSGYQELDALWMFIPLSSGLEILSGYSAIDSVLISTENPFDIVRFDSFLNKVQTKILLMENLPQSFEIYTWRELNRGLFYSFTTTKNLILFIVFLITLVASINISHALVMLVMERRAEIAILKATGASPTFITLCFLTAGFFTSFLGLTLALPFGVLISIHINEILKTFENVLNAVFYYSAYFFGGVQEYSQMHLLDPAYYLEEIPVTLDFYELYFVACITLALSFIVSLVPAIKAGREKPLLIMRKI